MLTGCRGALASRQPAASLKGGTLHRAEPSGPPHPGRRNRPASTLIQPADPYLPAGRPRVELLPVPRRSGWQIGIRWYDVAAWMLIAAAVAALLVR